MIAPSRQTIETFEKLATPFDDRFEQLHIETATLASLRDALLPKLISGELRVEDAERWVEEGM
jgi:type I restriction enzyme S subunit